MTNYLNQISRSQFEMIRPELETARKRTAPRTQDLYQVFNALLYLLKTGCQWRQLPHDFPKWSTVYYYYRIWLAKGPGFQESLLEQVLKKLSLPYDPNRIAGANLIYYCRCSEC